MKINFTKKEYLVLLQTLEIADWVLHAFYTEAREETAAFWNLHQRILSYAKEMGCEQLVERYEDPVEYLFTREYEVTHSAREFLREYEDASFWIELADRLAERDLVRELGRERYEELDPAESVKLVVAASNAWTDEFEASGLDNLILDRSKKDS